jgi:hypothetical protein
MKLKMSRDRYFRSRGGTARWLLLGCASCGAELCRYQKDGTGELRRLYLDRFHAPREEERVRTAAREVDAENLVCRACGKLLAVRMIYERERRPAWRLVPGTVHRLRGTGGE